MIEAVEFGADILCAEVPIDGGLGDVAPDLSALIAPSNAPSSLWPPWRQSLGSNLNSISTVLS